MKKYQFLPILLLLTGFSFLISCGNDTTQTGSSETADQSGKTQTPSATNDRMGTGDAPSDADNVQDKSQVPLMNIEMQAKALTGLLQGKWVNEGDPSQTIQFMGNKVKYSANDQLVEETDFSIDYGCDKSQCLVNGKKPLGWCLTETSASGDKCKAVFRIDQKYLVFQDITGGGGKVQYKKE